MRRDVQEIFRMTPHEKQVMMFSATLSKEMRTVCKKFMQDVIIPCCHYVVHFMLSHQAIMSIIIIAIVIYSNLIIIPFCCSHVLVNNIIPFRCSHASWTVHEQLPLVHIWSLSKKSIFHTSSLSYHVISINFIHLSPCCGRYHIEKTPGERRLSYIQRWSSQEVDFPAITWWQKYPLHSFTQSSFW